MIHFHLSGLPPSLNHAYYTMVQRKGGKNIPLRVLTTEGKKYKIAIKTELASKHQDVLGFFKPDRPYCLVVKFFMKDLSTKTWAEGKAQSRYKKVDVSNRLKLFEDALTDACGHDDSQHFRILCWKEDAPPGTDEVTEVWAWCWEDEVCPFDELSLRQ